MKFYSPAIITAKESVVFGHGTNIVWCDVIARHMASKGNKIDYFYPSWNHQGKRYDNLDEIEFKNQIEILEKTISNELESFGISKGYTPYRDTDNNSKENSYKYFKILIEQGFIQENKNGHFLNLAKVYGNTSFLRNMDKVRYNPRHLKKRLIDLTQTLDKDYPISKIRKHATKINSSDRSINPIFDLGISPTLFSEDSIDYSIDGSRTLVRGTFIPMVLWSALFNKPFSRNICAHGYLEISEEYKELRVSEYKEIVGNSVIDSDVLRYCALLPTNSLEDIIIGSDTFKRGKKMLYRASNLSKHIIKHFGPQRISEEKDEKIDVGIEEMRITDSIDFFIRNIYELSHKIERGDKLEQEDINHYLRMVKSISCIFPSTINRIGKILNG